VPGWIVDYDFSWNEVGGVLQSVRLDYLTEQDQADLGLTGGCIASDYMIGGCQVCNVPAPA
jgi:hypothetical protein